ncbi:hypothetical protein [Sinorhizobium americanum]|uniref:hypothetical protein n=1 Tax=Sinorhizobium americanum TaxID=194963 RepID=UPI0007D9B624|nr:hypothetical protein [Sinorhizobium americanum]OAP39354.1 hypothetical protein ATC00_00590 [Sinorhizobium americanum]
MIQQPSTIDERGMSFPGGNERCDAMLAVLNSKDDHDVQCRNQPVRRDSTLDLRREKEKAAALALG